MKVPYFKELDTARMRGKVVVLDLDGTLVPDGTFPLAPAEERVLTAIRNEAAFVVVVSNNLRGRAADLRRHYGVAVAESNFKKPSRRSLGAIVLPEGERVVVGDKVTMDGLLAYRLGGSYVRTRMLKNGPEPLWLTASHVADALIWRTLAILPYVALLRPRQWVKNMLIFVPLVFAGSLFNVPRAADVIIAFVAFSLAASAGYAVNDTKDRTADAMHPIKRSRPVASGTVSPRAAALSAAALFVAAVIFSFRTPFVLPWLIGYATLSLAYSFFLKHVPLVEMLAVAAFFLIRIEAGGAAAMVPVSPWLLAVTFLAAFFVAAGKRYAESLHEEGQRRAVLNAYSPYSIRLLPIVAAVLLVGVYVLYSFFGAHFRWAPYSSVFVAFGVFWYLRSMFRGKTEEPDVRLWKDPILFATVTLWMIFVLLASYA